MPFDATPVQTTLAALRVAREGVARPGGWTRGVMVQGSARCAVGWVREAAGVREMSSVLQALASVVPLSKVLPLERHNPEAAFGVVARYNDEARDQSEIVALFDRAIASLESRGPLGCYGLSKNV